MKHFLLGLAFAVPATMLAANPPAAPDADAMYSSSVIAASPTPEVAPESYAQATPTVVRGGDDGRGRIVGSFGFAGIYTRQFTLDSSSGQYGANGKTNQLVGWSITPAVNFTKHFGFQGDFITTYNQTNPPDMTKFSILAGPRYTFNPYWKATPFVFAEAGETRTTFGRWNAGHPSADWNPTADVGIGFDVKVSRNIAVQVVPGEWKAERYDWNNQWQHNYQARLGFVFYLRK